MKLITAGVNYINIQKADFLFEYAMCSFSVNTFYIRFFSKKKYWQTAAYKMLVKLTSGANAIKKFTPSLVSADPFQLNLATLRPKLN